MDRHCCSVRVQSYMLPKTARSGAPEKAIVLTGRKSFKTRRVGKITNQENRGSCCCCSVIETLPGRVPTKCRWHCQIKRKMFSHWLVAVSQKWAGRSRSRSIFASHIPRRNTTRDAISTVPRLALRPQTATFSPNRLTSS